MVLDDIIIHKRKDLEALKRRFPIHRLKNAVEHLVISDRRSFRKALIHKGGLNIICELKKASPSEGIIREDFQPLRIASQYEYGGACALSVLTETHYFRGRPSYLKTVKQVTGIPVLRKDFIFESYQIYESVLLGADAYLLISSILTLEELASLIELGREFDMEALVEVHTDEDLKKALDAGASILGINNRNLRTLVVDVERSKQMLPHIPKKIVKVVESGLTNHEQLISYRSLGADAFLIGTALMRSPDIVSKLEAFLGSDRKWKKTEEA